MIEPPPRRSICGAAACIVQMRPSTPQANMRSTVSPSISASGWNRAQTALLTGHRRPELAFDGAEHRVDIVAEAHVNAEGGGLETPAHEFGDRWLEPSRADVDAGDARPFASETLGDRKADAARSASDDADPVLQPPVHALAPAGTSPNDLASSRSRNFCTLPAGVFGRSATISIRSGQYCLATLFSAI